MDPKEPKVTVENLTNSLAQIEIWIKAVRAALSTLDPRQELHLAGRDVTLWTESTLSPIKTGRECPPPE